MALTKLFYLVGFAVLYVILFAVRYVQARQRRQEQEQDQEQEKEQEEPEPEKRPINVRVVPEQVDLYRHLMEEHHRRNGRPMAEFFEEPRRGRDRARARADRLL